MITASVCRRSWTPALQSWTCLQWCTCSPSMGSHETHLLALRWHSRCRQTGCQTEGWVHVKALLLLHVACHSQVQCWC